VGRSNRIKPNSPGSRRDSGRIRGGILGRENDAKNAMNERLRLISGREQLILTPTDGDDTLARATDVFSYIDSNFQNWACDVEGQGTEETPVQVYEMVENSTFQNMVDGLEVEADRLCLAQAQIKQFVKRYPDWLKKGGNGTFFLFKAGNEFVVAAVYFFSDGRLGVRARRFSLDRILLAKKRHRLVVPQLALKS
jgi:hypothetical protein